LDATTLKKRFTVLTMRVLYRGCAIPVAWKVVGAEEKGSWRPHWIGLLTQVQGSIPPHWTVLVLTDRGLYARWLYEQICALGWHPFMRINRQGHFRPVGERAFRSLATASPQVGNAWCGQVECFSQQQSRLHCSLLACWAEGYQEVWLVLTDLEPTQTTVAWYGMRSWIEAGFKATKRGGWHWHQTKMVDPARAERLWLAIAVATFWVVSVGGEADAAVPVSSLAAMSDPVVGHRRGVGRARPRMLSCFARGLLAIVGALIRGEGLLFGWFHPEPWPTSPPAHSHLATKRKRDQARLEAAS
jgi:hypothetical protein